MYDFSLISQFCFVSATCGYYISNPARFVGKLFRYRRVVEGAPVSGLGQECLMGLYRLAELSTVQENRISVLVQQLPWTLRVLCSHCSSIVCVV